MPRSKRLFRDLVSLQVPEEQVLNAALREKLALLPPQARAPPPKVRHLGCLPYHPPQLHSPPPKARDSVPLPEYNLVCAPTGATWPRARHDHIV